MSPNIKLRPLLMALAVLPPGVTDSLIAAVLDGVFVSPPHGSTIRDDGDFRVTHQHCVLRHVQRALFSRYEYFKRKKRLRLFMGLVWFKRC